MPPSGSFGGRLDGCWYARAEWGVQFRLQVIPSHHGTGQLLPPARRPRDPRLPWSQRAAPEGGRGLPTAVRWPDDGVSAAGVSPTRRTDTVRMRAETICCDGRVESRLQRICTSNAQPGHQVEGCPQAGRRCHAFGAGVPDSPPREARDRMSRCRAACEELATKACTHLHGTGLLRRKLPGEAGG